MDPRLLSQNHPFFHYQRRPTRTVFVGDVAVGGNNPLRIQSMTTSDTKDTEGTVREIVNLVNAGCEIVRLTVPTKADCDNLKNIRRELKSRNIKVPIVADIHFTPSIAMDVVDFVEKVRINPGNFVDKKLFKVRDYTDSEYGEELARIEEKFAPLVLKCKDRGVSMRVGTNHGSLSDRIMNRYGDTPLGMVESALEFLRIAARLDYHDIILSMKASNTQVMITAYRLLARRLAELGMDYPFHLGVTEAGEGEDGRIKSAIGIGTLLEEGIGDTIRVSLTEDSEHEIPVAAMLAAPYNQRIAQENWNRELKIKNEAPQHLHFLSGHDFKLEYERRNSAKQLAGHHYLGHGETVRVWTSLTPQDQKGFWSAQASPLPFEGVEFAAGPISESLCALFLEKQISLGFISDQPDKLMSLTRADKISMILRSQPDGRIIQALAARAKGLGAHVELCLDTAKLDIAKPDFAKDLIALLSAAAEVNFINISFSLLTAHPFQDYRILAAALAEIGARNGIHLRYLSQDLPTQLDASAQLGGLLIDGIGDSIHLHDAKADHVTLAGLSYNILQGARIRTSKTEYISCPSCGRTLFNLQKTTERIRTQTHHLKGVKIAIMGCIVNGPGEMADADFGYVGTGVGRISLYVGKNCVERNIPEAAADARLIDLIKEHGRWVDLAPEMTAAQAN